MDKQRQTAGETAKGKGAWNAPAKDRTLVIFRDCHAKHNEVVVAKTPRDERRIRLTAMAKGYLVAERKRKPSEPTCDNCDHMTIRKTHRCENTRYCELMGQYIPDNEHAPGCDYHKAIEKFERRVSAMGRKGGER